MILTNFAFISRNLEDIFQSKGLEIILQVPGNGAEVDENYDARNGLSAILSVLK